MNQDKSEKIKSVIPYLNKILDNIEEVYSFLKENDLLDTQESLDFLDELNRISVKH